MPKPQRGNKKRPTFRRDAVVSRQKADGQDVFIVKNPSTDSYHRFGAAEWFIIQHLDGTAPSKEIQNKAKRELGAELERDVLDCFVAKLEALGLLESIENQPPAPEKRLKGSLLYLRFKTLDPDNLLDRMVGHVRWCFTRSFVITTLILMVLAFFTLLANSAEIARDFGAIFKFSTILPAWLIMFASMAVHEFAHGLTCKHYGGRVKEMGLLLLFFQPGAYCNISDAWLFPEKSHRIWASLAGTYIDLVMWALAVFAWRITAPETALNFIALLILGTSSFRIFFNLNPLIKLDGYYVLSDWVGIPNLRAKAFVFIKEWIKRPWALSEIPKPKREKRIFLVYGLFAMTFSVWFLSFILSNIAGFLTGSFQGTGFIIFVVFLAYMFRNQLRQLWQKLTPGDLQPAGGRK